ncbi:MAG: hypothetical protein U5K51_09675 [Flavobacteriaceae bacterium]|nr:hypothetical protein [Flavobacteriaceae bacterium]
MEEKTSNKNNRILLIALTALLFLLIGYTFFMSRDHKEAVKYLQDEKEQIIANLTAMEEKYDIAIAKNTSLTDSLTIEKSKIVALKDSVKNVSQANAAVLRRYKNQIAGLEAINARLLDEVDSLKMVSNVLIDEKDSLSGQLQIQTTTNEELTTVNKDLARKVEIGSALNIKEVKVTALNKRSNGKYTETTKAQKTDAIKIQFRLMENEIATPGDKQAYVVLQKPNGSVVNAKGTVTIKDGTEVKYTDETTINYANAELDVVMFVENTGSQFEKGTYPIKVYVEGKLAGVSKLVLDDSFLGL